MQFQAKTTLQFEEYYLQLFEVKEGECLIYRSYKSTNLAYNNEVQNTAHRLLKYLLAKFQHSAKECKIERDVKMALDQNSFNSQKPQGKSYLYLPIF